MALVLGKKEKGVFEHSYFSHRADTEEVLQLYV